MGSSSKKKESRSSTNRKKVRSSGSSQPRSTRTRRTSSSQPPVVAISSSRPKGFGSTPTDVSTPGLRDSIRIWISDSFSPTVVQELAREQSKLTQTFAKGAAEVYSKA